MRDVRARTLKRAAEIVGGEQQLALQLKVTPSHLALWLQEIETPPDHIFLKAVDLVTEHDALPKASQDEAPVSTPGKHATSR